MRTNVCKRVTSWVMSSVWPWSLTMLLMMASVAQAIVIRHDTRDAHYLDAARSNAFANVGQLYSGSDMRGTGVLVGDRWVLTAAHVVGEALLRVEGRFV